MAEANQLFEPTHSFWAGYATDWNWVLVNFDLLTFTSLLKIWHILYCRPPLFFIDPIIEDRVHGGGLHNYANGSSLIRNVCLKIFLCFHWKVDYFKIFQTIYTRLNDLSSKFPKNSGEGLTEPPPPDPSGEGLTKPPPQIPHSPGFTLKQWAVAAASLFDIAVYHVSSSLMFNVVDGTGQGAGTRRCRRGEDGSGKCHGASRRLVV